MKCILSHYFLIVLGVLIAVSCNQNYDEQCFNGNIYEVKHHDVEVTKVQLKSQYLDGNFYGWFASYDSIMIFYNQKLSDSFYQIFNLHTGEEIGEYCGKGGGVNEYTCLGPISSFYKENGELKTLLFAVNEQKLIVWNITQSMKQGETAFDDVMPYSWSSENNGACYNWLNRLSQDTLLAKVQSVSLDEAGENAIPSFFQLRSMENQLIDTVKVFNQAIKDDEYKTFPEFYFSSNDAMKPDGTKIVQAMCHLAQINIIDVQSKRIKGYRLEGTDDFSVFTKSNPVKSHYVRLHADNQYIYAAYWGKDQWGMHEIPEIYDIHVFDWDGNLKRKLLTDKPISGIWKDEVDNRLYITSHGVDEMYYCDIDW